MVARRAYDLMYRFRAPWETGPRGGRALPGLAPDEPEHLFGDDFTVERCPTPAPGSGFACFLLERST